MKTANHIYPGSIEGHIRDVLAISAVLQPDGIAEQLPFFLRDTYTFYRFDIAGHPCLAMVVHSDAELTPASVRKHIDLVAPNTDRLCVLVQATTSAYHRARLIEQRVPFIIPGQQLFLPQLGMDLRDHYRQHHAAPKSLGPATQVALLHALLQAGAPRTTPLALARDLGYSAMTMTRAVDELEHAGLVEVHRQGRERIVQFPAVKRAAWQLALPMLRSPVSRTVWVRMGGFFNSKAGLPLAGLSALAEMTLMAQLAMPCLAVGLEKYRDLRGFNVTALPEPDGADVQLQVWRYDPMLLASNGFVDPLSLYLSLADDTDERVSAALDELMEQLPWS